MPHWLLRYRLSDRGLHRYFIFFASAEAEWNRQGQKGVVEVRRCGQWWPITLFCNRKEAV